jgi:outer membrane murein-binding lipoprotein Lpp
MSVDDRILYLVRKEIGQVVGPPDTAAKIDDLHAELHELATRVTALEAKIASARARTSKAPDA